MISPALKKKLVLMFGDRVAFDEPMSRHTSLGVGGPADVLFSPRPGDDIGFAIKEIAQHGHVFPMGMGTNLLFPDHGFRGTVVMLKGNGDRVGVKNTEGDAVEVEVWCGEKLSSLYSFALDKGLSGMEWAVGIPGCVGGALCGNAGTRTGCMADVFSGAVGVSWNGEKVELNKGDVEFAYRSFSSSFDGVFTEVRIRLVRSSREEILSRARTAAEYRKNQPAGVKTAGCTFKNPPGASAGELIDRAGLKGMRVGGAFVSDVHANFIVNDGSATSSDVIKLVQLVARRVRDEFGVKLEPEIVLVGMSWEDVLG